MIHRGRMLFHLRLAVNSSVISLSSVPPEQLSTVAALLSCVTPVVDIYISD